MADIQPGDARATRNASVPLPASGGPGAEKARPLDTATLESCSGQLDMVCRSMSTWQDSDVSLRLGSFRGALRAFVIKQESPSLTRLMSGVLDEVAQAMAVPPRSGGAYVRLGQARGRLEVAIFDAKHGAEADGYLKALQRAGSLIQEGLRQVTPYDAAYFNACARHLLEHVRDLSGERGVPDAIGECVREALTNLDAAGAATGRAEKKTAHLLAEDAALLIGLGQKQSSSGVSVFEDPSQWRRASRAPASLATVIEQLEGEAAEAKDIKRTARSRGRNLVSHLRQREGDRDVKELMRYLKLQGEKLRADGKRGWEAKPFLVIASTGFKKKRFSMAFNNHRSNSLILTARGFQVLEEKASSSNGVLRQPHGFFVVTRGALPETTPKEVDERLAELTENLTRNRRPGEVIGESRLGGKTILSLDS